MSKQASQSIWKRKYRAKTDQEPPAIYEELNAAILAAQPGETSSGEKTPRLPQEHDFPKYIELRIIASNTPKEDIQYVIVVLHGYGADIFALEEFSKKHLLGPKTACVLIRGTTGLESEGTYCWSDKGDFIGGPGSRRRALQAQHSWQVRRTQTGFSSISGSIISGPSRSNTVPVAAENTEDIPENDSEDDTEPDQAYARGPTFEGSTKQIGIEVITNVLIKKCGFRARDIALVGHDQGGSAALAVATGCWETKLGGVVTIGGRLPSDYPSFPKDFPIVSRCPTNILVLGGKLGDVSDKEVDRIESSFSNTTKARMPGKSDDLEVINETKLRELLAHQLRREEWTKEAVISFDGGGIRGYGSLLMLKDLMIKVAHCEKELDRIDEENGEHMNTELRLSESSFSPCAYPSIEINGQTRVRDPNTLEEDELYLPCHYFTFAGGTSTGGLISIMLSRFRMSVRDCLKAYKDMGSRVFGSPRPPDFGLMWHKFNAGHLERVIRDIVSQHGERVDPSSGDVLYPSPEALCKTIVAARADKGNSTNPFLFRTYDCRTDNSDSTKNPPLNAGPAAPCSIVQVGRATSAAPTFFEPIDLDNWGNEGYQSERISFIDGGFGLNNPSHEILKDIKRKRKASNSVFEVFASFGTGVSVDILEGKLSTWRRMLNEMKKEMTNVLRDHQAMENECGLHNEDGKKAFEYFRFPGGNALGEIEMDEWSGRRKSQLGLSSRPTGRDTLESMDQAVHDYLRIPEVREDMTKLARILVLRRRLRTRDVSAWERYACASRYECSQVECNVVVDTLDEFGAHLDNAHANLSDKDRLATIQASRQCWVYRGSTES